MKTLILDRIKQHKVWLLATTFLFASLYPSIPWLTSFSASILFFLCPLSIGALIFQKISPSNISNKYSYLTLLSQFLIGVVSITFTALLLEHYKLLGTLLPLFRGALALLTLLGIPFLVKNIPPIKTRLNQILGELSIGAVVYYLYFLAFTNYPFRPIFQEIHFIKGALELTKYGVLNLFTADSYIPVYQTLMGVLNYNLTINFLETQWTLPIIAFLLKYTLVLQASERFNLSYRTRFALRAFLIMFFPYFFSMTNGDVVLFSALLSIFAIIQYYRTDSNQVGLPINILIALPLIISINLLQTYSYAIQTSLILTFLLVVHKNRASFHFPFFLILLMAATCLPLHRSMVLFFAIVFSFMFVRSLLGSLNYKFGHAIGVLYILVSSAIIIVVGGLLSLNNLGSIGLDPELIQRYSFALSELLLHKKIDSGVKADFDYHFSNSIIELLRVISPSHLALLFVSLFAFLKSWVLRKSQGLNFNLITLVILFNTWFIILVYLPLPSIYRGISLMLAFSFFALIDLINFKKMTNSIINFCFIALCAVGLAITLHALYLDGKNDFNIYAKIIFPFAPVLAALGAVTILWATRKHKPIQLLATILFILFVEKFSLITFFYKRAYSNTNYKNLTHTHYSEIDLNIAKELNKIEKPGIVLSDPITMSNIKAFTGWNSAVTYQNINSIPNEINQKLKIIFNSFFNNRDEIKLNTKYIGDLKGFYPEAKYFFNRIKVPFNEQNVRENLYIVVNEKSKLWANCGDPCMYDYFPLQKRLIASDQTNKLKLISSNPYFKIYKLK